MKRPSVAMIVLAILVSAPAALAQTSQTPRETALTSTRRVRPVQRPSATPNGTYQIAIYDSFDFASGGRVVILDRELTSIIATYFNWDKVDVDAAPECREIFTLDETFDPPIDLESLAQGVALQESYEGGARIEFTITLTVIGNQELQGTIHAIGTGFQQVLDGCNGPFPEMAVLGGKSP